MKRKQVILLVISLLGISLTTYYLWQNKTTHDSNLSSDQSHHSGQHMIERDPIKRKVILSHDRIIKTMTVLNKQPVFGQLYLLHQANIVSFIISAELRPAPAKSSYQAYIQDDKGNSTAIGELILSEHGPYQLPFETDNNRYSKVLVILEGDEDKSSTQPILEGYIN